MATDKKINTAMIAITTTMQLDQRQGQTAAISVVFVCRLTTLPSTTFHPIPLCF